jgi:hypothetical protein
MNAIGGYFELELRKGEIYHKGAMALNTARNCFEYVLQARQYTKVYIPYYTCEVMLEPIHKLKIEFEFYHINELLEPVFLPKLEKKEAFLYTNYYGLKQDCVKCLAEVYGNQLIVDNAQAFFAEHLKGIDTFYSARKFFGVPDGAYLYTEKEQGQDFERDVSYNRVSHLLKRIDFGAEEGYCDFCNNDNALCGQKIKKMSKLTESLLSGIDYESAKQVRRDNYALLDKTLRESNMIHLEMDDETVPMVYPYMSEDSMLRQKLIEKKVFVATYWPNVREWTSEEKLERTLVDRLVPLPIDYRYGKDEMESIIRIVNCHN